jgi:hypothetical protein
MTTFLIVVIVILVLMLVIDSIMSENVRKDRDFWKAYYKVTNKVLDDNYRDHYRSIHNAFMKGRMAEALDIRRDYDLTPKKVKVVDIKPSEKFSKNEMIVIGRFK